LQISRRPEPFSSLHQQDNIKTLQPAPSNVEM